MGVIESILFKSNLILDFIVRRLFLIPGVVSSYYIDHVPNIESISDITYEIGANYFMRPDMNSNTNFIIMSYASFGLIGIIFISVLTGFIFSIFNNSPGPNYPYLGQLMCCNIAFTLTEQAFHTSLLSSGVIWSVVLCIFLGSDKKR
tara:strand:- start:294 stop:734 length:441 start_codon:yes stop_codon:yes gene_type:complete